MTAITIFLPIVESQKLGARLSRGTTAIVLILIFPMPQEGLKIESGPTLYYWCASRSTVKVSANEGPIRFGARDDSDQEFQQGTKGLSAMAMCPSGLIVDLRHGAVEIR